MSHIVLTTCWSFCLLHMYSALSNLVLFVLPCSRAPISDEYRSKTSVAQERCHYKWLRWCADTCRGCVSAYNSERAVRWPYANVRNKAPTMRSSLTSSSWVNRATPVAASIRAVQTPPCRDRTSRVFMSARDR